MIEFFKYINLIKITVLLTLAFALVKLDWKNRIHQIVISILSICMLTEIINSILVFNKVSINFTTSISQLVHHSLWLFLLHINTLHKKISKIALYAFILFGLINLFFGEGLHGFTYFTFIVGALIYIVIFIIETFNRLKQEDFTFFLSNNFLLLMAPLLFFFGLSFMFGFKSNDIMSSLIFGNIKLYTFIIYFVNIIYYSMLNIYIYKEKRAKNGL